jgi:erythronate-4-phosphate dehydrogenase
MKIIVDEKIPFLKGTLERFAEVQYVDGRSFTPSVVNDADALVIRTRTKCDSSLLKDSKVKAIFTATIGYDHIDRKYCHENGIHWQNAPGCNSTSVQQYFASALAMLYFRKGYDLRGKTIAVIGVGNVGSKVVEWCRLLGLNVLRVDPFRAKNEMGFCKYDEALRMADIITFHTPLTYDGEYPTFHLFSENSLAMVRQGVILINTSRGEVVDTVALKKGLASNIIAEAVIDVWENEPHIDPTLHQRVFIYTPHVAGYSYDSKRNGSKMTIEALCRFFNLNNDGWQPEALPAPNEPVISISPDTDMLEAALTMLSHTYDIMADDNRLRLEPTKAEEQRGNYPLRREIEAYTLHCESALSDYLRRFGIR